MSPFLPHRSRTGRAVRGSVVATAILVVCAPGASAAEAEPRPLLPDLAPVVKPIASSVDQLIGVPVVTPIVQPVVPAVDATVDDVEATVANVGAATGETIAEVTRPITHPARPASQQPAAAPAETQSSGQHSAMPNDRAAAPLAISIDLARFEPASSSDMSGLFAPPVPAANIADAAVGARALLSARTVPGTLIASALPAEQQRRSPITGRDRDQAPPLGLLKQKFAPVGAPAPPAIEDIVSPVPAPPVDSSVVDRRRSEPRGPPLVEIPVRPD